MESKSLYMLAIMPPAALAEEIHRIRLEFAEKYHCKAALKPPVHITLIPPYWALPVTEQKLSALDNWAATQQPFTLNLKNYGTFRRNGVVFIDVEQNAELKTFYKQLTPRVKELLPGVKLKGGSSFNPHFTIGYRDIPQEVYEQAADEYGQKTFSASFIVDKFFLWKHNRKFWEVLHTYPMLETPVPTDGELFH